MTDLPWWHRATSKTINSLVAMVEWPGDLLRSVTAPFREKNKQVYYHRKFRRVTSYEDCEEDDAMCHWEANEQYNRNRLVDETIVNILRQRVMECALYYGQDQSAKCKKEIADYDSAELNFFTKYGDLGVTADQASACFRKQQHRLAWERKHKRSLMDGSPLSDETQ